MRKGRRDALARGEEVGQLQEVVPGNEKVDWLIGTGEEGGWAAEEEVETAAAA